MTRFTSMILAFCLSTIAAFAQTKVTADDVIKMATAGLSEEVILLSIGQAQVEAPSVDQIIQLKNAGASDKVITAMFGNDKTEPQSTTSMPVKNQTEKSENGPGLVGTAANSVTSGAKKIGGSITSLFGKKNEDAANPTSQNLRIHISAQPKVVNGVEFRNQEMGDSVEDLKGAARDRGFELADGETDADLKLVLLERRMEEVPSKWWKHNTRRIDNALETALFQKENSSWQPVTTMTNTSNNWRTAADNVLKNVQELIR